MAQFLITWSSLFKSQWSLISLVLPYRNTLAQLKDAYTKLFEDYNELKEELKKKEASLLHIDTLLWLGVSGYSEINIGYWLHYKHEYDRREVFGLCWCAESAMDSNQILTNYQIVLVKA